MKISLYGVEPSTMVKLHDAFMPHTIITASIFNNDEKLFLLELSEKTVMVTTNDSIELSLLGDSSKTFTISSDQLHGVTLA